MIRSFERRAPWFPDETDVGGLGTPWTPPPPAVCCVATDPEGLLWILSLVPASTWADAWPEGVSENAVSVPADAVRMDLLHHGRVAVIDPDGGRLLAETDLDGYVINALPDARVAVYSEARDGLPRVTILQLEIRGRYLNETNRRRRLQARWHGRRKVDERAGATHHIPSYGTPRRDPDPSPQRGGRGLRTVVRLRRRDQRRPTPGIRPWATAPRVPLARFRGAG